MTEPIRVCSYRYADKLLKTGQYRALISIGRVNGGRHCELRTDKNLVIGFDDSTPWNTKRYKGLMGVGHMMQCIEFARGLKPSDSCLIHCKAGRSRSVAVAVVVHYVRFGHVQDACDYVAKMVPKGWPNAWVLQLADVLLGLAGSGTSESLTYYASFTFPKGLKGCYEGRVG